MNVLLFLGSGISFASGIPDTKTITNSILYEEWHSHTDENFYSGPELNPAFKSQNWILRLQPFLRLLKSYADAYYSIRRDSESDYEDLYYIARQIADEELAEIDNPIIDSFLKDIKNRVESLCAPMDMTKEEITLAKLASRSCDFILCVLWERLYTENEPMEIDLFKELALSDTLIKLDIFTLNHDLLIEKLFQSSQIKYIDGFDTPEGDIRYFNPSLYEKNEKIRLFKLHGSINWFRFRTKSKKGDIDRYGIPLHPDHWHCKDSNGNFVNDLEGKPIFLVGTYNKIFSYDYGIFDVMHYWFRRLLNENDIIIMSGYGWNDKGINGRLMEWIYSSNSKKLLLLHKNPEEIKEKSKSAMWHRYDDLVKNEKLVPIKKWFGEMNLSELIRIIKKTN